MATYFDPNANGTNTAWTGDFNGINDGVRSPTNAQTSGDGATISSGTAGALEDTGFGTGTHVAGATYTLYIFSGSGAKRGLSVSVNAGSSFSTIHGASAAAQWRTLDVSAQITSQADLDNFAVRWRCDSTAGGGGAGAVTVYAAYLEQVVITNHALAVADELGLAISTGMTRELPFAVTDPLGMTIASALIHELRIAAAADLGLGIESALRQELPIVASDSLNLDIATALTHELALAASAPLALEISTEIQAVAEHSLAASADLDLAFTTELQRESFVGVTFVPAFTIDTEIGRELVVEISNDLELGISSALARETFVAASLILGPEISTDLRIPADHGLAASVPLGLEISTALQPLGSAYAGHRGGGARRRPQENEPETELAILLAEI